MVFKYFWFFFNYFSTGKIDKLDFEMPIIPQTLNINNLRATSTKSINLYSIRKLIEYSLKKIRVKARLTIIVFEILLSKVFGWYYPPSWVQGAKGLIAYKGTWVYKKWRSS